MTSLSKSVKPTSCISTNFGQHRLSERRSVEVFVVPYQVVAKYDMNSGFIVLPS